MNGLSFTRSRTRLGALLLSLGFLIGASAVCAQAPLADGQVIKIDQATSKITIKHGPLKQFGMDESMTMVYRAAITSVSRVADMSHELPDLVARWLLLNRSNAADAAGRCRYRADTSRDIATQREKRSCIG
jgi:hypothetical protein